MGNLLELLIIFALAVLNGIFAMSETAIVSVKRVRLQQRAEAGDDRAQAALELTQRPERFLSTVQIGITLIGILAGAFGGAGLSQDAAALFQSWGLAAGPSKTLGFVVVVALITYLSLVIGELVPKSLALNDAEGIATRAAGPMTMLSRVASPLVSFLTLSTRGVLFLLGVKPNEEPGVTEDEIKLLIAQGTRNGIFEEEEREIVEGVFRTADRRISSLMTPRREIIYLDLDDSWERNLEKITETGHSAYPICRDGLDGLVGIVSLKRLWDDCHQGARANLEAVAQQPVFLLESTRALQALDAFKGAAQHIALVVDEYGQVVGLVTLHDLIEAMVGSLPNSPAGTDSEALQREDGSWLLDGLLAVDEFLQHLNLKEGPEDADEYDTLGGFVMARLGTIPREGDSFEWSGIRFEVLDMDGNRVDRVLAQPLRSAPSDTSG